MRKTWKPFIRQNGTTQCERCKRWIPVKQIRVYDHGFYCPQCHDDDNYETFESYYSNPIGASMKITIQYDGPTLIPESLDIVLKSIERDIIECRYEPDKIICIMSRLRRELLGWIDDNKI